MQEYETQLFQNEPVEQVVPTPSKKYLFLYPFVQLFFIGLSFVSAFAVGFMELLTLISSGGISYLFLVNAVVIIPFHLVVVLGSLIWMYRRGIMIKATFFDSVKTTFLGMSLAGFVAYGSALLTRSENVYEPPSIGGVYVAVFVLLFVHLYFFSRSLVKLPSMNTLSVPLLKISRVIVAAAVASVLLGALLLRGDLQQQKQDTLVNEGTESWETYTSDLFQFSMKYPRYQGLQKKSEGQFTLDAISPQKHFRVGSAQYYQGVTLQKESVVFQPKREETITVNGREWLKQYHYSPGQKDNGGNLLYITPPDDPHVFFQWYSNDIELPTESEQAEKIIATLEIHNDSLVRYCPQQWFTTSDKKYAYTIESGLSLLPNEDILIEGKSLNPEIFDKTWIQSNCEVAQPEPLPESKTDQYKWAGRSVWESYTKDGEWKIHFPSKYDVVGEQPQFVDDTDNNKENVVTFGIYPISAVVSATVVSPSETVHAGQYSVVRDVKMIQSSIGNPIYMILHTFEANGTTYHLDFILREYEQTDLKEYLAIISTFEAL